MDKIIKKSFFRQNLDAQVQPSSSEISRQKPSSGPTDNTRSHSGKNIEEKKQQWDETRPKGVMGKLARMFQRGMDIDSKPTTEEYKFKHGDRVVLQSIKERPITGTVRWVGPMRISKEPGVPQVIAVGVETVSLHNYIYIVVLYMFTL